jgi:hypothetical protein
MKKILMIAVAIGCFVTMNASMAEGACDTLPPPVGNKPTDSCQYVFNATWKTTCPSGYTLSGESCVAGPYVAPGSPSPVGTTSVPVLGTVTCTNTCTGVKTPVPGWGS